MRRHGYADGLTRNWTQISDAHNSRSVYVGMVDEDERFYRKQHL